MSYAQLLDPKGFAKEAKAKKPASQVLEYGPQQSRKPALTEPNDLTLNLPKFDPKALLNPKAAASRSATASTSAENTTSTFEKDDTTTNIATAEVDAQPGTSNMIERMYGVTNREAPPQKKRKVETTNDNDAVDMEDQKKAKSKVNVSGGGQLGEYFKTEREKGASESGPSNEPIDLTNDDDDDVVILSETRVDDTKEVCLGRLFAQANAFRIPSVPKYQANALGNGMWPQTRVNIRRLNRTQNNIIELFDKGPVADKKVETTKKAENIGLKFGTVDIRVASTLCPLMDGSHVNGMRLKVFVDACERKPGEVAGSRVSRILPLSIVLYAPKKFAHGIGRRLSHGSLFLSAPQHLDRGIDYVNPHLPQDFNAPSGGLTKARPQSSQASYVTRTQEEMVREANSMFDSLVKSEKLPEMEPDSSLILTPLMSHQKQALHFLSQHERSDNEASQDNPNFSLWKERTNKKGQQTWYNVITNHELPQKPEAVKGGILADMMGLGKTLSILALVTNTLREARAFGEAVPPLDMEGVERNAKATLIICPKSVMSNWEEQVNQHTKPKRLKVYSYHGATRTQDLNELAEYHIVLTTYSTAAAEFSDKSYKRNALASIQWFRIVLDEAHQIRTQNTQASKGCCALAAQRRWAVTGTPVQNRLDDLGALIKFLRIKPFDDNISWAQHILAPFRNANEHVLQHLRLLVDSITLRRMKDKIGLTQRNETIVRLDFTDDEMNTYRQFASQSHHQLKIMLGGSNRLQGKSYAHVLRSISRLRAVCAHGREMLGEDDLKELEGLTAGTAIELGDEPTPEPDDSFISEKQALDNLHMMSESEVDLCISCSKKIGDKKSDPDTVVESSGDSDSDADSEDETFAKAEPAGDTMGYLTPCYHLVCPDCKDKYIEDAIPKLTEDKYYSCSYCEQYVRFGLFELRRSAMRNILEARNSKDTKGKGAKWDESTYSGPSTKVKALLEDLKQSAMETAALPPGSPPVRSVVFSGWTSYLDLIEYALDENNISFVRLDGSMSLKARASVLHTFKTIPYVTVLLVSIKAGGQGLNFTAANKVYMMEPQFNPGVEQQAIDRVHRLGQERDVEIKHYVMKDSVEESILKLQEKKVKLAQLSLERKMSRGEEARKRIEDLKELFK